MGLFDRFKKNDKDNRKPIPKDVEIEEDQLLLKLHIIFLDHVEKYFIQVYQNVLKIFQ